MDSSHDHGLKTYRSPTGLIGFLGSTPVIWLGKRKGDIASSTYAADFSALCTVIKEAHNLRYMLCCLWCNVPIDGLCPTNLFGDNLSMILNAYNLATDLSKKRITVFFHVVREAIVADIISPY